MNLSALDGHSSILAGPSPGAVISDITLLSIAILFGFVGNARVCYLLKKRFDLRKVPHFLFASLAVNGIVACVAALPSRLATATLNHHLNYPLYAEYTCNSAIIATFICGNVNAVTLSLMAIDRQDCVLRPFTRRMTRSNIKVVIAASWIGILMLSLVLIVGVFYSESVCDEFNFKGLFSKISDKQPVFLLYYIGLGFSLNIVSFFIFVITAIRIIITLRSSPLPDSQSLHRRQEIKLTWLTYKICGVFIVCWLPPIVTTGFVLSRIGGITAIDVLVVTTTISYYYYVLNPLLYFNLLNRSRANNVPRPANREEIGARQRNESLNEGQVVELKTEQLGPQ